ncbi:NADH-cytochrome b5 reductase [Serendipita sp. 396]|nr:NADH-cytochrome b5 reductase [Serendipita sp. 396]KAG8783631.1 NADH-cytochrome b5 reductase [Serendipita sp. 397]KAG8799511.1 NADH-cytochrome b5 reductase [Serendipita sp. 398]KAG8867659.1 NADH-cytochrome b5 reductase [Serendipita sp. 405]
MSALVIQRAMLLRCKAIKEGPALVQNAYKHLGVSPTLSHTLNRSPSLLGISPFSSLSFGPQKVSNNLTPGSSFVSVRRPHLPQTMQTRQKSIFEHRWFHPEPKPGEPPKQSYRVFWTMTIFLGAFSAAYLQWVAPYLQERNAASGAAVTGAAALANAEPVFDKDKFQDYTIKSIKPYNANTKLFTFATPQGQATNLSVASALFARPAEGAENVPLNDKGEPVVRWYTPVSDAGVPGEFTLMIKRYDDGKLTPYIHSLKEGDKLAFKGPIKKFAYKANEFEQVGLIGGGSGITPLYQIVRHALKDKSNTTKFTLLYGNLTEDDILLRRELDELKRQHPRTFDVVYFVDKKTTGDKEVQSGFIGIKDVKAYLPDPKVAGSKVKVFVCGPPGQMQAISGTKAGMKQGELSGALKEAGFIEEQVYKF